MCEIVNIGMVMHLFVMLKKDHECDKKAIIYEKKKDGKDFSLRIPES